MVGGKQQVVAVSVPIHPGRDLLTLVFSFFFFLQLVSENKGLDLHCPHIGDFSSYPDQRMAIFCFGLSLDFVNTKTIPHPVKVAHTVLRVFRDPDSFVRSTRRQLCFDHHLLSGPRVNRRSQLFLCPAYCTLLASH